MSTLPSILLAMERAAKSVPLDPCGSVIGQLSSQFPRAMTEWPTLNVGWPPEGTFDLIIVKDTEDIIVKPRTGHPNQVPYIVVWWNLIENPPPWLKPFLPQQVLFTTEERDRIQMEARKLVPGLTGEPSTNQTLINADSPLTHPNWDYNMVEDKESFLVYCRTPLLGLKVAACRPTNLSKVYHIECRPEESPATFLKRLQEAFRR
ncbi:uncharacterized protein LOC124974542 isoform X2 [Sciurus carolinensis]|nr:uncharacterized protein LOC124974542 isoform X2 [Sciurus carolinensis]